MKNILNLKKILKNLEATESESFARGYEKCQIVLDFFGTPAQKINY